MTVLPAVGYDDPDQSHFTSRHYWEVGATNPGLRTGWLGRVLDATGAPDNPLQGLSLDGQLAPALATARVPVAAIDGPDRYDFWTRGVWGDVERRMLDALATLGEAAKGPDPALTAAGEVALQAHRLRGQLLPFAAKEEGKPAFTSPVRYPHADDPFPGRMAGLAAMLAAGLPLRLVVRHRPGRVRHARRPARRAGARPASHRSTRCTPSSATSRRAGSPTACSSTSGASSGAGRGRTARAAPTTAPRGRASCSARASAGR